MTEPTPIRAHRRYTKRQKATAVIAAEMSSVAAAAEGLGIPETTLTYWFDAPEFAELRAKTREDLASETNSMAHLVLGEIRRRIGEFEPRDLSVLYGILTDKGQLLSGGATSRTEHRELVDEMDDHEREALRSILADAIREQEAVSAGD